MCTERAHNLGLRADRLIQRVHSLDLAPVDRAVDRPRVLLSGSCLDRPTVDQQVKTWVRSTGRLIGNSNDHKYDRWLTDIPVDQQAIWPGVLLKRLVFVAL